MLSINATAQRIGTMVIDNYESQYDTVEYRNIGPGTTYMKFQFPEIKHIDATNTSKNKTYKMIMYVLKVDLTNPFVQIAPYLARGKYYSIASQADDVKRMKRYEKKKVLASAMGNAFYSTSGISNRVNYECLNSVVSNGKVFYDEGDTYVKFSIDANRKARVSNTTMKAYAEFGTSKLQIGQVNHYRDFGDSKKRLSLFCNGIPNSVASNTSNGVDVRVKVTTNDGNILVGAENKCTVTAIEEGCGHKVNTGEAIISGIDDCETALRDLSVGDVVNISITYDNASEKGLNIQQQLTTFSGATKTSQSILNGKVVNTTKGVYPVTTYGCSKDGNTAYIAALQISEGSDAPCNYLSEAMKNLGEYNAIWVDGGPSSEITVDGSFVTTSNLGSSMNGREIPSGVIILSTAPDDMTIASIKLQNQAVSELKVGDTFTPQIYAYNKNDEIVDYSPLENGNITITCDANIGTVTDGKFTATTAGTGYITIALKGSSQAITIPVTISDALTLTVSPKKIFTGEGRECQVQAFLTTNGETEELNASDVSWSTEASMIIQSCDNGLIVPFFDGVADVIAEYRGLEDIVEVTVENLPEAEMKEVDFQSEVAGLSTINKQLPSVPTSFSIEIKGKANVSVTIYYTTGEETKTFSCTIPKSGVTTVNVPLDYDNNGTYPVTVNYIKGTGTPTINNLTAYYGGYVPSAIEAIHEETSTSDTIYNTLGMKVSPSYRGIIIKNGKKHIAK